MTSPFSQRLKAAQSAAQSVLCVGLDPDPERLPESVLQGRSLDEAVLAFNRAIIDATRDVACAFKPNLAFYEALGRDGWRALMLTIRHVPDDTLVILDAKRGDIGNSARFYAKTLFENLEGDACTVSPYMGGDSVQPFLRYPGRAAFVLARTTNPGAADVQERRCGEAPLYEHVARQVARWDQEAEGMAGLVAGATDLASLRALREAAPRLPFLIPGIGAQGGDPQAVIEAAATDDGHVLVNSSRSILYASDEKDFAEAAAQAARRLRDELGPAM